jgi:hypothetical protein
MLAIQRYVFNKRDLDYQYKKNQKIKSISKTILLKPNSHMIPTINEIIVKLLVV